MENLKDEKDEKPSDKGNSKGNEKPNNKGNSRSKKPNKRRRGRKKGQGQKDTGIPKENKGSLENQSPVGNPNWYFSDKELAEQASRFSFQSFIGNGELTGDAELPSIMVYALNPSLGGYIDPSDSTAAVNMAARKLYSTLSSRTGRTSNYGPQDVMTSILAMGEIVSLASHLRRIFGLAFTCNARNRDLPKHLIHTMGIDADDLFKNLSVYRVQYNTILNIANQIAIPANLTWFNKCDAIYQGVYQDSPDDMAQLYVFVPATTWKINETMYEGGTVLETVPVHTSLQGAPIMNQKLSVLLDTLRVNIERLLTSSTLNLVYADIINYAEKSKVPLLHLAITDELYSVVPKYDEEVLLHIHNMNVISTPAATQCEFEDSENGLYTRYNDVYPSASNNNLTYMPIFGMAFTGSEFNPMEVLTDMDLVDFPDGNPDLTKRLEATRFSARYSPEIFTAYTTDTPFVRLASVGDHYCVGAWMYSNGELYTDAGSIWFSDTSVDEFHNFVKRVNGITKFRRHHLTYALQCVNDPDEGWIATSLYGVVGELNYFTRLDANWLNRVNSLCFQGLLDLR